MSEEVDDFHSENMISTNQQCDIELKDSIGEKFLAEETLFCAYQNKENNPEFAFACGPILLICDGTTKKKVVKKRFELEFEIKKVFFHKFLLTRTAEKESTPHGNKEVSWRESPTKPRDYLVVCGEHRLQFMSLPDFHFYHYEIPFKLRSVFTCSTSILVERFYDSSTEQNFHLHDTFHLYSLSGPFGELLPVIYKTNGLHPQWKFCWQSHQDDAGMVDTAKNYVVVYDQKEKNHRIYMARETEEQEVHAAIRYVETLRKQHDSTMYSSLAPQSAARTTYAPTPRSPAMIALSEVINSDIEGRSPMTSHLRSGFGHSTPNNPNIAGFQGTLPTPIFEGNNDSHIWASTPNTPRVNTRGGLERNIHTRTLARMVNDEVPGTSSSPTHSYGRLQTTVSPFRSQLAQKFRRGDSNAELLKDFTRMIRDTPRNTMRQTQGTDDAHVDFGDLERDPDVDLLLSKVCLECVYVEPKKGAISKANKIFISTFLSESFINLLSSDAKCMKIISVWKNAEKTKRCLAEGGKYQPVTMDCVEATYVGKSGLTIVLGSDFTISMIGGNERIAPIFIAEISNQRQSMDFRFHPFADNRIAIVNATRCILLEVPETVLCKASSDLMKTCFLNLNREFALKLLRKWRTIRRDYELDRLNLEQCELEEVCVFMLDSVGVRLTKVAPQERAVTPDEHGGKQMRPRMSEVEVATMMREFFEEMAFNSVAPNFESEIRRHYVVELDPSGEGFEHARDLFNALHAQCQEWSMLTLMHPTLTELIPFVYILSAALHYREYEEYYVNLFRSLLCKTAIEFKVEPEIHEKMLAVALPPLPLWNLYDIIAHLIYERTTTENLGVLPKVLPKKSLQLLVILAAGRNVIGANVKLELQSWIGNDWGRRLGLTGKARISFNSIMKDSRSNSAGRANNLMRLFDVGNREIDYLILAAKVLLLKFQTDAFAGARSIEPVKCTYATREEIFNISLMRWKHDIRKRNVEMMLDSTRPILIATNVLRKSDDDNMKELQDRFLTQTSYRTFCQCFGRAYYEFRTAVPSLLTTLFIPRLCVGGMVYPARVTCDPPSTDIFKLCTEWANFYNSMAASLRIGSSDMVRIDNEWIVMVSKTIKSNAVIGGMFLGFGLNGHLASFNMYHAHQMLASFDRFNSVALLIGLSASKFKSCDLQIHKILATYLGFLMGPTPLEIKLDITIQTAAISALGLLFADSGNMNIAKKLVNEIGKGPNRDEEPVPDRAAYKLSAGFSLGLIMLGKGNGAASNVIPFKQNIPSLSQRLIYMMKGMRRDKCVFLPQSATPVVNETSSLPFSNGGLMNSSQVANHVKESNNINIHQSAEPATIALGLMFMKTHNEFIANALALPETITDIERLKPDSLYSRVLGYCLVMWDKVEPTQDFVKSLIPSVIQEYATSALHFGVPVKRDEDGEEIHEPLDDAEEKYWADIIDRSTIAQTYLYAVSAACMAIALKYSSCGGPKEQTIVNAAFRVIEFYAKIVLPDGKSTKNMGSVRMCMHAGSYTRASCLSMLITAMAILRVGTGDLEVMRYARLLRLCDKPDNDWISMGKKHFEQMVSHQALGILLMGEGRYAFKKDDLSIALTIIATFPTIPQNVSDNSHYHQPLRFLWSLAVEPRLLVPFDAAEGCVVEVDVIIVMKSTNSDAEPVTYKQKAPALLPPLEELQSISVGGGKYEVVRINLQTEEELEVMRDVMSVGQGRVMLKRYSVHTSEMKINEATALYDTPLDIMDLFQNEKTSYCLDETEIRSLIHRIEEDINLNSSDEYPNVQVQLSSVRDVTERTHSDLISLQQKALQLLGDSLDLWPDEVNVSSEIHGLAESMKSIQI